MRITTGQVAALFQVSTQTVINWTLKGQIKFYRLARGPRSFKKEDLLAFIKREEIHPDLIDHEVFLQLIGRRLEE